MSEAPKIHIKRSQPTPSDTSSSAPSAETGTSTTSPMKTHEEPVRKTYVTYEECTNMDRMSNTANEQKTIPGTGPTAKPPSAPQFYNVIPFTYDYGVDGRKAVDEFHLEGPMLVSATGIISKPGPSGKPDHSIMVHLHINEDEKQKLFYDTLLSVYRKAVQILFSLRAPVKMYDFNPNAPESSGFKNPLYLPRDTTTGNFLEGRDPSLFFKLFKHGYGVGVEQTLFTDLEGKPIPWKLLESVTMKFIPLIHIKRIYIGAGKASLQMVMLSAVVTSIHEKGSVSAQIDTMRRLREENPHLVEEVSSQVAKISMNRQDALNPPKKDEEKSDKAMTEIGGQGGQGSTYSGIQPTGGSGGGGGGGGGGGSRYNRLD